MIETIRGISASQWQAIAAMLTLFAAIAAVWATIRAPKLAAEFAEKLRSQNQKAEEDRRLKLFVFTTLMQYRLQILNINAVSALNLIDVVFNDEREVREAWRSFKAATDEKPSMPARITERYLTIVEKMARALGLSESITIGDIQNAYYPVGLGQADEANFLETQEKLQRFKIPISPSA